MTSNNDEVPHGTVSRMPWLTDHWAVSQHNFDPTITVPARPVVLHDTTVRDGEESARLAFSVEDKTRIAEALAQFVDAGWSLIEGLLLPSGQAVLPAR
jgi:hypothetical protein